MKKSKKATLFLLLCATVLASCKKETNSHTETAVTKIHKGTLSGGDGKWDLLGYGLDVTGNLLDASSVSDAPVFDMKRFETDYLNRIDVNTTTEGSNRYISGLSATEFTKEVNNQLSFDASGNLKVEGSSKDTPTKTFTGSLSKSTSDFNSFMYSSKYSYATWESLNRIKRLRFTGDATIELLNQYLTPEFLNNINTYSAEELVQRYGTHVMLDISLGGSLRFNYSGFIESETDVTKKASTLKAGLGLPILKAFSININGSKTKEEMTKSFNETRNKDASVKFYGGTNSGRSVTFDQLGNTSETMNLASWEQSITDKNAALIDVGKAVYLYNFIADPTKRAQVKAAIEQHIANSQVQELGEAPVHAYYHRGMNVWRYEFSRTNIAYLNDGNWEYKGDTFYAMKTQVPGSVPIYESYAPSTSDCTWSQDRQTNPYWQPGGVKFYAFPSAQPGAIPIYRYYYHYSGRSHFLGTSPARPAPQDGWTVDGIVFYTPN